MSITAENIFEKGVLVNVKISAFTGRAKLSSKQIEEKDLPTEIVRGVVDLYSGEMRNLLKRIEEHDNKTRNIVWTMSIPFPIDGIYFVSAKNLNLLSERLNVRKEEREKLIEEAAEYIEQGIKEYSERFPEFYEENLKKGKYLNKERFKSKFNFKFNYFQISVPNENSANFITSEIFNEEMKKFKNEINEMKAEVVNIIHAELLTKAKRLLEQSTTTKPNQKTLNTLNEFFDKISNVYSDFIDRKDLEDIIKKFKETVSGVNADDIRTDGTFKKSFAAKIKEVANTLEIMPNVKLQRAIEF